MLILTRRVAESIIISEGASKITVTLLGIKGGQVRVGIDAPKDISVHREEIFERLQQKKNQSLFIKTEFGEDDTK